MVTWQVRTPFFSGEAQSSVLAGARYEGNSKEILSSTWIIQGSACKDILYATHVAYRNDVDTQVCDDGSS